MNACVFPGQGSQFIGMGSDLFEKYPDIVEICDKVLDYSIVDLCLNDKNNKLNMTEFTQPALYTVNAMYYYEMLKKEGKPLYVAGHSLGEYNALLAAEVFNFETGLKLVKKRGELMGKAQNGAMAAVIGLNANIISTLLEDNKLDDKIFLANYNAPNQLVISGEKEKIKSAKTIFMEAGARAYAVLQVSGAFHSPFMKESMIKYKSEVDKVDFKAPCIPVIANMTAKPYETVFMKQYYNEDGSLKVIAIRTHYMKYVTYVYLCVELSSKKVFVIDPAGELDKIEQCLNEEKAQLQCAFITHSHIDHTNLANDIAQKYNIPVFMSKSEIDFYDYSCTNLSGLCNHDVYSLGQNS